jgi:peptidoglycan LD-endopeptidase CwlK
VMGRLGHPMVVTDGLRSLAQQQYLYSKGRTRVGENPRPEKPLGDTVTDADGTRVKSNHQMKADGYSHAADLTFSVNGVPQWNARDPWWDLYGHVAEMLGLEWGGRWTTRKDRPHVQLPEET